MNRALLQSMESKGVASRVYNRAKLDSVLRRERSAAIARKRVHAFLEPLIVKASELGLTLVVENRSALEAFPTERELLELIRHFDTPHLRYWHDFGHAQLKENLGLLDHAQWLADVAPFAVGGHLQDARWPDDDHLPPFDGEIDFTRLVPLLPKGIPYVLELSPDSTPEAIRRSAARWNELFPR
jgi:sugar phosphate isomerase/epimerase